MSGPYRLSDSAATYALLILAGGFAGVLGALWARFRQIQSRRSDTGCSVGVVKGLKINRAPLGGPDGLARSLGRS
jgi:hypothetical protein